LFPTTYNEANVCLEKIGRVIEIRGPHNVVFQWLGNKPVAEASKPFAPGWVDPRDNKGYYSNRPLHSSHPPWTNRDTATNLAVSAIIAKGDVLSPSGRVSVPMRSKIEAILGERIAWGT